jgi:hypothetical protein
VAVRWDFVALRVIGGIENELRVTQNRNFQRMLARAFPVWFHVEFRTRYAAGIGTNQINKSD